MARPETLNDLSDHQKSPHEVFKLDLSKVELSTKTAPIYTAVANLGELFELAGFQVKMDGPEMVVHKQRTMEELTKILANEQRDWDSEREDYLAAIQDPIHFKAKQNYRTWAVDRHARTEGLPAVDWPAEEKDELEED